MRVEVVFETGETGGQLEIPWESEDSSNSYADLRENAKAIDRLEAARQHPPLRSLLMAVNSGDSIFSTARSKTWLAQVGAAATEPCEFASRVDLVFAAEPFNLDGGRFASLTQRLQELLAREASPDTQRCELRVCPCHFRARAQGTLPADSSICPRRHPRTGPVAVGTRARAHPAGAAVYLAGAPAANRASILKNPADQSSTRRVLPGHPRRIEHTTGADPERGSSLRSVGKYLAGNALQETNAQPTRAGAPSARWT
jgi:hypothetical protein